ncbi:MAG: TonB C-terminal domain-containing protein [Thermodesulfobacteriaceae bacterium]|nr:TonB C-terminal domain-containing protein [Thermodesulfobacteriaceae bacterium]MDW8135389.1 TonB C-terminal domain-containing protein [Thermodesulfobacterium sp.]
MKEEEIKVSLVSPLLEGPSFKSIPKSFSDSPSTKAFKKEVLEEDTIDKKIGQLRARREVSGFSKLTSEELRELEGKIKGLKGKSQGEETGAQGKEQTLSPTQNLSSVQKGEGGPSGNFSESLLLLIKRRLQTNFEVPIYLKQKSGLKALVSLEISPKGEILNYRFLQSSDEPLFNQAVERCLKISQPFPVKSKLKIVVEFKAEGVGKIN